MFSVSVTVAVSFGVVIVTRLAEAVAVVSPGMAMPVAWSVYVAVATSLNDVGPAGTDCVFVTVTDESAGTTVSGEVYVLPTCVTCVLPAYSMSVTVAWI